MDRDRVKGRSKQVKGVLKEVWGMLADDRRYMISGLRDQREGKVQQDFGYAKDRARKDFDDWIKNQPL
jgi:uncharacterized protein YjbJ (UPF0337 family)